MVHWLMSVALVIVCRICKNGGNIQHIQWNLWWETTINVSKNWSFKRGGLSSEVYFCKKEQPQEGSLSPISSRSFIVESLIAGLTVYQCFISTTWEQMLACIGTMGAHVGISFSYPLYYSMKCEIEVKHRKIQPFEGMHYICLMNKVGHAGCE